MTSHLSSKNSHTSVVRVADDWYIVGTSQAFTREPVAATLLGTPLVLFRNSAGEMGALLDRCPHRNAPLSAGRVRGDIIQCAYHGWEFDTHGKCRKVPGLLGQRESKGRMAASFPVREQDGFVWVFARPDEEPSREPFGFPSPGKQYTAIVQELEVEASLHATAENALDVPHTAYLHGGLFRSSEVRVEIEVVVRRFHDRVEAEYIGEPRPAGMVGKLLAPRGGTVTHTDRFLLPAVAQIEYRIGDATHLLVTNFLTPVTDFLTKIFSVVHLRLPIPARLVAPLIKPLVMRIFRQDADILKRQTDNIRRFGGERFASTEIDVLGPHIYRLLKQAERGERERSDRVLERRVRMLV